MVSDGISSAVSRIAGGGATEGAARPYVVDETPSHTDSGSDDEDNESQSDSCDTSQPKIRFRNVGGMLKSLKGISSAEQYLEAVMNWSSKPFAGVHQPFDKKRETSKNTNTSQMLQHVSIGEYTVAELTQSLQDAADVAGFCIYEHKGHNEHKGLYNNRCTLKFGCECGRKRYAAKEKERQPKEFVVDFLRMRNLKMTMVEHLMLQTHLGLQRFLGRHKTLHLMNVTKVRMKPLRQSVKIQERTLS